MPSVIDGEKFQANNMNNDPVTTANLSQSDGGISELGEWSYGTSYAVAVVGTVAFLGEGRHFSVVNISTPATPVTISRIGLTSNVRGIHVVGDYAYLAMWEGGLQIIDVSDPNSPDRIAFFDTPGPSWDIQVVGNYAYLADGHGGGLMIIDVTNPLAPSETGRFDPETGPTLYAFGVAVAGNYAYLAADNRGFLVINIQSKSNPIQVGQYDSAGLGMGVQVAGQYAFLADGYQGFAVVDITTPSSPFEVDTISIGDAHRVEINGNYAYVSLPNNGLSVVNLSIISSLTETTLYNSRPHDFKVIGNLGYMADIDGMAILNISDPSALTQHGRLTNPTNLADTSLKEGVVYVVDSIGIRTLNISEPSQISQLDVYNLPSAGLSLEIQEDYAYTGCLEGEFTIVDISNPDNIQYIGSCTIPLTSIYEIQILYNYACLATSSGLVMVNITDPNNPSEVGRFDHVTQLMSVDLHNEVAYVGSEFDGFRVVNITDPTQPEEIGNWTVYTRCRSVVADDETVYITHIGDGLTILDVSNPRNPMPIGGFDPSESLYRFKKDGVFLYAGSGVGLRVINISNPVSPEIIGPSVDPVQTGRAYFDEGLVLYSIPQYGLWIYEHDLDGDDLDSQYEFDNGTDPSRSDSDSDSLSDYSELFTHNTNPLNNDTDFDLMPDGWEVETGTAPLVNDADLDPDEDTLTNLYEYFLGTHPYESDTDNNGVTDDAEDFDGDGLPNAMEIFDFGYSPLLIDTDENGVLDGDEDLDLDTMPNRWEVLYGTNPLLNDTAEDPDSDTLSNLEEYTLGLDPLNPDSDFDSIPDGWEVDNGFDPTDPTIGIVELLLFNIQFILGGVVVLSIVIVIVIKRVRG